MNRSVFLTRREGRAAFVLWVLFCLLNAYQLTHFNVSIDDEMLYRGPVCTFAELGRWLHPLLRATLWPQPVAPAGPLLIFGALFAISFVYVLRLFRVGRLSGFVLVTFAAYAAYPVWLAQLAFSANVLPVGIGVFCVSWAALRTAAHDARWRSRPFWLGGVLPAALGCAVALGAYQSLGLMYLVLVLGAGLALRQRAEPVHLPRLMATAVLTLIVGAALSWVAARLMMAGCGDEFSAYGHKFVQPGLWRLHPDWPLWAAVLDWVAMYYRNWRDMGAAGVVFLLTLLVSLLVCILRAPPSQRLGRTGWLLLLTLLPALLSLVVTRRMPARTFLGAAAVLCCLLLLAHAASATVPRLRRVVAALALLTAVQGVYVNSVAQARGWAVARHDQALAAAIYGELARQNGGGGTAQQPIRAHFSGIQPFGADVSQGCAFLDRYYPAEHSTTTGGSFFGWDGGSTLRIVAYMNLLGYTDLQVFEPLPLNDERAQWQWTFPDLKVPGSQSTEAVNAAYAAMPSWPAPGSVARFGDVFLVKLSPPIAPFTACQQLGLY